MSADEYLKTPLGRQLFNLLPEVYRTRDTYGPEAKGDLARFLDACGQLLTLIRRTLDQRLADCFPDQPASGLACQAWLLPYFAELLDVRLVSPDEVGRRHEVAHAVAWRQRKGTPYTLEQIAEKVGRLEVEVQEGWQRVATTARIGLPLLPAKALGESAQWDWEVYAEHPNWRARHPGLPATIIDLRYPSRAMQLEGAAGEIPQNPAAQQTNFAGHSLWWRQVNPHGSPCFPGSYEDVSRRTVDFRTPNWQQGQAHPKRAILYFPPPPGFFEPGRFPIQGDLELNEDKEHVFENTIFTGKLRVTAGKLRLQGCAVKNLAIITPLPGEAAVLTATGSLLDRAEIQGLACLEYCTVLAGFKAERLQASDSIFLGDLSLPPTTWAAPHCVRFSRIPAGLSVVHLLAYHNTSEPPVFYEFEFDHGGAAVRRLPVFGEPGCAVLHPASAEQIRFGAEDGGEMGAYHDWRYSRLLAAVQEKLRNFLPVGMEAVMVPDLRLHRLPLAPCPQVVA
ncbi:MAG: phage tail protein [Desulfobacca sp.]|nr:phage tail protein [Desulfobacca sp.]